MSQRERDIKLLHEAIEMAPERLRDTFEDMLAKLEDHDEKTLTEKQRNWALEVVGQPVYENLVSSGKAPRGREVPTPAVLQNRPLKPPGKK